MADPCTIPPLPASARTLASFFPLVGGHQPLKNIEFAYAWMRAMRKVDMAAGSDPRWPRQNIPLASGGTITAATLTTLTDSAATFTTTPKRCGINSSYVGATIKLYVKDDPRYVYAARITSVASTHVLNVSVIDAVERGIVPSLSALVGVQYEIFDAGDICSYDRWPDPPNAFEYVSQYQLAREQGLPGSFGNFASKTIAITAGSPTYTLHTGGGDTSALTAASSVADIQSAIASAVGGSVVVAKLAQGTYAVAFGPGVSTTLTVASQSGGTVVVNPLAAGTLVDPHAVFGGSPGEATNRFATAQPSFPDAPTRFDLVIWDSGGPATAATATATVTPTGGLSLGQLARIAAADGGAGYTSAPAVTITAVGAGSGAAATATVASGSSGTLSVINATVAGAGYTSPTVTITGGGGTGATATATVGTGGGITSYTVTSGGSGYTGTPTITITDSTGSGAAALGILAGGVSGYTITSRGSGYTQPPLITLTGGGGTGAAATAALASGPITSINVTAGGAGYQSAPLVAISSAGVGDGGGHATVTASISGGAVPTGTSSITIDAGGRYTATPSITFGGGGGDLKVHRYPITANTSNALGAGGTITVGSLGGWSPSLNFYYSVIAHDPADGNSIWNPQARAEHRTKWYSGAYQSEFGLSHLPDDSISLYPQAAQFVYFDSGDKPPGGDDSDCEGPTPHDALDQDVWNDCCDPDCCSEGNKSFSPNVMKSHRAWQKWLAGKGAPWVFLPLWTDKSQRPPTWKLSDVMSYLGFNSAGFIVPEYYAFRTLADLNAHTPSIQVADDGTETVVDPPGVSTPSDAATATCTVTSGAVNTTFTISHGGSGYVSPPRVVFTGGGGTGAAAVAHISGGAVTSITRVSGGSGYTSAPTITLVEGGEVLIGFFSGTPASTHYLSWNPPTAGEGGAAFAAGDVAEYQGFQAYQLTLPTFRAGDGSPLAPYMNHLWVGTCGASPPNPRFAGKVLRSSDPTDPDYLVYDPTGISSDGAGLQDIVGPLQVVGYANRSGLTSQITVKPARATGWNEHWYTTDAAGTAATGTATGGAADSITDSSAPFLLWDWGLTLTVTHGSGPTAQVFTAPVNGVSVDLKTLHATGLGYTPVAGDAWSITRAGGILARQQGVLTATTSTTLTDASRANDPWFASGFFDGGGGQVVHVYHENGDGTQTLVRHLTTAVDQANGKLTVDAVTGDPSAAGDRWVIELAKYNCNRFSGLFATATLAGGLLINGHATFDAKVIANDRDTVWIQQAAGVTLTDAMLAAGVTLQLGAFGVGSVLKRDPTNARWLSTFGQAETRTDHATGNKPAFSKDLRRNLPGIRTRYGFIQQFTLTTLDMWNQMYAVILTLIDQVESGHWTARSEDNDGGWLTDEFVVDKAGVETACGFNTGEGGTCADSYDDGWNCVMTAEGPDSTISQDLPPTLSKGVSRISDNRGFDTHCRIYVPGSIERRYSYYDGNLSGCFKAGISVQLYGKAERLSYPAPAVTTIGGATLTDTFDPDGDPFVEDKYNLMATATTDGSGDWLSPQIGHLDVSAPPPIHPIPLNVNDENSNGYVVVADLAIADYSSLLGANL